MSKQVINIGIVANDNTGDPLRTAMNKINLNFTELYDRVQIPSQSGNAGKYLTTNGSNLAWGTVTGGGASLGDLAITGSRLASSTSSNYLNLSDSGKVALTTLLDHDITLTTDEDGENNVWTFSAEGHTIIPNGGWVGAQVHNSVTFANTGASSFIDVKVENTITSDVYEWQFDANGTFTLPEGGTITEGIVTSNPTIQLTPASPDVASQKLVIKGGGAYDYNDNDININYYTNTAIVGDTLTFYINSPTYADQTLYWWIYPQGAGISDPESGTVALSGASGIISFVLDSDDNEFTVRVSPEDNNYDPANTGVESGLINPDAPTFDSEHHLHLTTGDLTETSIFLGTDDHNVRTTVNGGIEITTPNTTDNVWQFKSDGDLELPTNGGIVFDRANTTIRVGMGFHIASGEGISLDAIDETDPDNLVYKNWYFGDDGTLTFPDSTLQETAWSGGRVVTVPIHSTGASGDLEGDLAFSNGYIYYCTADYGQVGHQVSVATSYNGATSLNTNSFQLTRSADTLQIAVGDIISDSDGGATSVVASVSSDANYTYVGTGSFAYAAVFPLTFTSTDYVSGGNIWKRVAWSNDTW